MRARRRILSVIVLCCALVGCLQNADGPNPVPHDTAEVARQSGHDVCQGYSELFFQAADEIRRGRIKSLEAYHKFLKDESRKAREESFDSVGRLIQESLPKWDAERAIDISEQLGEGFKP